VNKRIPFMQAMMKSVLSIGLVLVLAITLGACANQDSGSSNNETGVTTPAPTLSGQVTLPQLEGTATVEMVVNGAPIRIEVDGVNAPITAGNFVDLVQKGVYDGTAFHRVVREPEPFVVQGGDPQTTDPNIPSQLFGTGNYEDPATGLPRYIPLEIKPSGGETVYSATLGEAQISRPPVLPHRRGAVAMARSQMPDSASSQFYFALADLSFLDGNYAVFGYVTEGMEVVDAIQQGDRIESAQVIAGAENLRTE
jgi:peptidyl-prolyl cis-trans isomerase B (cyclophilin B)